MPHRRAFLVGGQGGAELLRERHRRSLGRFGRSGRAWGACQDQAQACSKAWPGAATCMLAMQPPCHLARSLNELLRAGSSMLAWARPG